MANNIKFDLSRVKTKNYIDWMRNPNDITCLFVILDAALEGGAYERPVTELPALLAQFYAVLKEFNTDIALAVSSMSNHLTGDNDD